MADKRMRAHRTCLACFELKSADDFTSPRGRKCAGCREKSAAPKFRPCQRCGEDKPASDFVRWGRVCAGCRALPVPSRVKRSKRKCARCFVLKDAEAFAWGDGRRGRGTYRRRRGVCLECEAAEREAKRLAAEARRASWEQDGVVVRRCCKCGEVKPLEEDFYVTLPNATGMKRWRYACRSCDNQRVDAYRRRMLKDSETRAKYAKWKRQWARRNPERYKAAQKRYADKIKADPKKHAAHLEACRIAYRLRQEAKGRNLDEIRRQRAQFPAHDQIARVPAEPLVHAIEAFARRMELTDGEACEHVGIAARNLFGWRAGERRMVQFDVADRVLTRLGLAWWDVWDASHREVFEGSQHEVAA